MAVVMEMKARNGVRIRFEDDAYAGCSKEELQRRQRKIAQVFEEEFLKRLEALPPEERLAFIEAHRAPADALPPGAWVG